MARRNPAPVNDVYMWVVRGPDGNEGPCVGRTATGLPFPLMTTDKAQAFLPVMLDQARRVRAAHPGQTVRLVRFTQAEVLIHDESDHTLEA